MILSMNLKFEFEVWFEVWIWSLNLKFKFEEEIWSWRSVELKKFEVVKIWIWRNLKLKRFEVEEISLLPFLGPKGLFLQTGQVLKKFESKVEGYVN